MGTDPGPTELPFLAASVLRGGASQAGLATGWGRQNHPLPPNQRLRFSYGIGYGEVLNLEHDLFGLEVNLASKLGEDLAEPGDVLLTPAAAAAAGPLARRLLPHGVVKVWRLRVVPGKNE